MLTLALVLTVGFAFASVESNLDKNSDNVAELLSNDFKSSLISYEGFIVETLTIDLGFFGCTSYVTVIDKDTKQVLAEFQYYDEECEGDSQAEFWYV